MGVADIAPVVYRDGRLKFLDQTLLPGKEEYIEIKCKEDVWEAIKKLRVRGAPAIGVAAAYGLAVVTRAKVSNIKDYVKLIGETGEYSLFGWRRHPVTRRRDFHTGIDIKASRGMVIFYFSLHFYF